MVAPGCEHQQRLRQRIHRVVQDQRADLFRQRRAAGLARHRHRPTVLAQGIGQWLDMGGFAGAVDAFKADEDTLNHWPRWNLFTARLCSSRVALNWLLPSPRATKYMALLSAGCSAASNDDLPGIEIGVGGRPGRV